MVNQLLPDDADLDNHITVGGILNSRLTRAELTVLMCEDTRRARSGELPEPRVVVSSNGLVIAKYHQDTAFKRSIDGADIVDVDGMPLVFATRLLCKTPLRERVATTDFVKDASEMAAKEGIRFYFLGAQGDVAQIAARNLQRAYPGLQIVGTRNGYFSLEEEAALCDEIVQSGADILWLGLGSPKQEAFALRNRHRLAGLAWIRTCGGLFDFYSERLPRAPQWMQGVGLEWLFRVLQEPKRLGGRYMLTNPVALYHLMTKTHD
ncbi:WecB/TagA/CpsF family glycosyltransferase [Sphingobium sp.]|uniref:WecB/TagA/CpsF family glycosyltransferase n=1 Tax=Sphingobium sp. TaxID=1912891 RepID=UPI003BB5C897